MLLSTKGMTMHMYTFYIDVVVFRVPGGQLLPNNSIVAVSGNFGGIFCLTNKLNCCESATEARWISPDGSLANSNPGVSVTRGLSFLSLNREADMEISSGLFRCEIPNAEGAIEELYIGLYSNPNAGMSWQAAHAYMQSRVDGPGFL